MVVDVPFGGVGKHRPRPSGMAIQQSILIGSLEPAPGRKSTISIGRGEACASRQLSESRTTSMDPGKSE
jgi:hypothetical protein